MSLTIRRPPRSTLFPYTTLSDLGGREKPTALGARDSADPALVHGAARARGHDADGAAEALPQRGLPRGRPRLRRKARSEEHTSELQSPYDLVCRLLLEKKKKKIT